VAAAERVEKDQGRQKYCEIASVAVAVASTRSARQLRTGDMVRARGVGVMSERWDDNSAASDRSPYGGV
jgi:hypothetical protein